MTYGTHCSTSHFPFTPRSLPQVLKYTAGHINYGGRVTDDWDRRCIMNILENFYSPAVLVTDYAFSESGVYKQLEAAETDHKVPLQSCQYHAEAN